jgi:hypothetical protein
MIKHDSVVEGLCDSVTNYSHEDEWHENDR